MRKIIIAVFFISNITGIAYAQIQSLHVDPDTLILGMGQRFVSKPGAEALSVGLLFKGKTHCYHFGTIVRETVKLPDDQTQYELGSISKTFAGYLLAKAIVEKKVRPGDDIRKYLKGNYPNLEYNGHAVTLIQLTNWTSGIPDELPPLPQAITTLKGDSLWFAAQAFNDRVTKNDFFKALHQVQLDTIPGFKTRHSNAAAQLLAYILENVYGDNYQKLVERYIFKPLHMDHTCFLAGASANNTLATGYNERGIVMPYFKSAALSGSAGISSTSADMLKYLRFLLDRNNPSVALSEKKTISVDVYGIAMNFFVYRFDDGNSQVWTDGSTLGFYDFLILYPEQNCGIILLSNEADATGYQRLSGFADQIFQAVKSNKK